MQAGEMTRKTRMTPENPRTPLRDDNLAVHRLEQD
jgi:hypothetical protein